MGVRVVRLACKLERNLWGTTGITKCCYVRGLSSAVPSAKEGDSTNILVEVKDGVRKITINRPEKKNALTVDMFRSLIKGLSEANGDDNTVVVALTGTGQYFTSGMDLTPRPKPPGEVEKPPTKKTGGVTKFLSSFVDCRKPIIALVNGPAMGAGVTILGHCDAIYASEKATFHTTFSRYGVPPEMSSTYTFPRIMGYARASNLLMFDRKMSAEEAFNAGLVSRVIPHPQFEEETERLLQEYGQLPMKSLMYSKDLIRGRTRDFMYQVSDKEQSYFDPQRAREIIKEFMAKKGLKKS